MIINVIVWKTFFFFSFFFFFFFFVLIENSYELTKRMNNLSGRKIFYFFKVSDSFA